MKSELLVLCVTHPLTPIFLYSVLFCRITDLDGLALLKESQLRDMGVKVGSLNKILASLQPAALDSYRGQAGSAVPSKPASGNASELKDGPAPVKEFVFRLQEVLKLSEEFWDVDD